MDADSEDIVVLACFVVLFLCPFFIPLAITACIAGSKTRKWKKEKARRNQAITAGTDVETDPLVEERNEDEWYDSEDEADFKAQKAEQEADWNLTPRQKFKKEFKKCWSGKAAKTLAKEKEREERRKLAKAVAKELDRRERRRGQNAGASHDNAPADDTLPSYNNATATDAKH